MSQKNKKSYCSHSPVCLRKVSLMKLLLQQMYKDNFQFLTLLLTKLQNTVSPNLLDKIMQLISIESHIYDLDRSKITDLDKFAQDSNKLMQLNYFKIKNSLSLFGHAFLCPCYLMTRSYYLGHSRFFISLSFSMQNSQSLSLVSLKSSLN